MDEQLLTAIQLRPGVENISAELLVDLIADAQTELRELINYPDDVALPSASFPVLKEMVLLKINRLGYEGISSTSVSGTSENFIDGYPADLMKRIVRLRRLRL
ncbi:hypothetical protein DSECCO2_221360 [anaerobic digester metagenome]